MVTCKFCTRLNKTADRNVEVVIEAVDEAGALLPEAISPGASATLTSEFSTGKYKPLDIEGIFNVLFLFKVK